MKVNLTKIIKDLKGEEQTYNGEVLSLREACYTALTAIVKDIRIDPTKKYKQAMLANIILNNDNPDLRVEDIKLLKDLTGEVWGPSVIKDIWDSLDPPDSEETVTPK